MNLIKWEPFGDFDNMFDRYNRLFGRPLYPRNGNGDTREAVAWRPAADISESDTEYLIKADLPDVKKDDVDVSVSDGMIAIKGERKIEEEEKGETMHRIESFYGTFSRTFTLPEDVDQRKISAESKDGVLRVHLPKAKTKKAPAVQIAIR